MELFEGNPLRTRADWLRASYQALVASTTPGLRWLILHHGFVHFAQTCGALNHALPFAPTHADLETIWRALRKFAWANERSLWPVFEGIYAQRHGKNPADPDAVLAPGPTDYVTERVEDGMLKTKRTVH